MSIAIEPKPGGVGKRLDEIAAGWNAAERELPVGADRDLGQFGQRHAGQHGDLAAPAAGGGVTRPLTRAPIGVTILISAVAGASAVTVTAPARSGSRFIRIVGADTDEPSRNQILPGGKVGQAVAPLLVGLRHARRRRRHVVVQSLHRLRGRRRNGRDPHGRCRCAVARLDLTDDDAGRNAAGVQRRALEQQTESENESSHDPRS